MIKQVNVNDIPNVRPRHSFSQYILDSIREFLESDFNACELIIPDEYKDRPVKSKRSLIIQVIQRNEDLKGKVHTAFRDDRFYLMK